jgi:hypothetical protein
MGATPRGISGSRAAAVLGLSEFVSRFEVWQQIKEERQPGFNAAKGYIMPVFEGNASTRWGLAFEDAVIQLAEQKSGCAIKNRELFFTLNLSGNSGGDPDSALSCHIDGWYDFTDSPSRIHNGKTTNQRTFWQKWGEPGTANVPQSYQIQAQHDMLVSGAEQTILSVLVFPEMPDEWERQGWLPKSDTPGVWFLYNLSTEVRNIVRGSGSYPIRWASVLAEMGFFKQYVIPADKNAQGVMLESYRKFWRDHIEGDAEPAPETPEDIARAFPAPVGTIVVTDQVAAWIAERNAITDEIGGKGPLSKRKDELKVLILDWGRKQDATLDDESKEKTIFMSAEGRKLASWNGKTFR